MRSKVQDSATSVFRAKMKALHRAAEPDVLAPLIEAARTDSRERDGIAPARGGALLQSAIHHQRIDEAARQVR